jgi:hypothetical protein
MESTEWPEWDRRENLAGRTVRINHPGGAYTVGEAVQLQTRPHVYRIAGTDVWCGGERDRVQVRP